MSNYSTIKLIKIKRRALMKGLICFTLAIMGIGLGVYVGGYLMFFQGLTFMLDLCLNGLAGVTAIMIAVAACKMLFAAFTGYIIAAAFFALAGFLQEIF